MNRFAEKCPHRRLHRLQQVATDALNEYGLAGSRLTFIGQSFNAVYRVDATDGQQYVLRVHRFNVCDAREMRSEFQWLDFLSRYDGVLLSEPVSNRHGDFVTEVAVEDVPGRHYCTMLRWHPGTPLEGTAPNHECYMAGELLAKLHLCSQKFVAPPGFTRPWRGEGYARDCVERIRKTAPVGLFGGKVMKVLDAIADHIGGVTAEIGHG